MKYLFTLLTLVSPFFVSAQSDTIKSNAIDSFPRFAVQGMYQNGYVFPTNKFLQGVNAESVKINAFQAFSVKFSVQTTGKKQWEQSYMYPQYGLGLYVADFFKHKEVGIPFGVY